MASDLSGSWERASLYYAKESAWSTPVITAFYWIRDSSVAFPYSGAGQPTPPGSSFGRGYPYEFAADFVEGREALAFSSSHPMSSQAVRDLGLLFFNGLDEAEFMGPLGAANAVVWTTEPSMWATVVVIFDSAAGVTSAARGNSCLISRLGFTFPANTPGETGGGCEISADWIGELGERDTTFTHTAAVGGADTGSRLLTTDFTFELGGTGYNFVSADLTFTNGASLIASANGASAAVGATYGMIGASGNVTLLLDQGAGAPNSGVGAFLTAWEAQTVLTLELDYEGPGETSDVNFLMPVRISAAPSVSEIGGVNALSFPFTLAGSATAQPKITIDGLEDSPFHTA